MGIFMNLYQNSKYSSSYGHMNFNILGWTYSYLSISSHSASWNFVPFWKKPHLKMCIIDVAGNFQREKKRSRSVSYPISANFWSTNCWADIWTSFKKNYFAIFRCLTPFITSASVIESNLLGTSFNFQSLFIIHKAF